MEYQVVYSIGVRCYTETILKRLGLVKFSSLFGSINIRNYKNLINCFDTNFKILLDESNLIYSKDITFMNEENKLYGFRTLNKFFDNIDDYHSATFAHYDLSKSEHKQHFLRGLHRLNYIRDKNIPILFVNISKEYDNSDNYNFFSKEYDNSQYDPCLIDSIIKYGFSNFKILSIYKTKNISEIQLVHSSYYMIIYKIPTYGYDDVRDDVIVDELIRKHYNLDKLLSINDFDGLHITK
jgi:hypothetical protein